MPPAVLRSGTLGESRHSVAIDGLVVSETVHLPGSMIESHAHARFRERGRRLGRPRSLARRTARPLQRRRPEGFRPDRTEIQHRRTTDRPPQGIWTRMMRRSLLSLLALIP